MHFIHVLHFEGQRIEINDDMEFRLLEFGILQGLDEDVVSSFGVIVDRATSPV
jgi:Fe2+ transport system protein FeoA